MRGLAGHVAFTLEGGRTIEVEASGRWAQRYSNPDLPYDEANPAIGGGLCEMEVRTKDGSVGTAIYEVTGQWHHKYFPLARGRGFPPHGAMPAADQRAR